MLWFGVQSVKKSGQRWTCCCKYYKWGTTVCPYGITQYINSTFITIL